LIYPGVLFCSQGLHGGRQRRRRSQPVLLALDGGAQAQPGRLQGQGPCAPAVFAR
jgi:hypothetical protein